MSKTCDNLALNPAPPNCQAVVATRKPCVAKYLGGQTSLSMVTHRHRCCGVAGVPAAIYGPTSCQPDLLFHHGCIFVVLLYVKHRSVYVRTHVRCCRILVHRAINSPKKSGE